jgi:cell division protease FtsH
VLLAGRIAEQIVFGDVSTGAENDLQRATDMARHMITHYGMSETLGLATYDSQPTPLYLNGPALPERRNCSERTAEAIDAEVRRLLDEARQRVTETLSAQRGALEALAGVLLEKEVVDRAGLDALLKAHGLHSAHEAPPAAP